MSHAFRHNVLQSSRIITECVFFFFFFFLIPSESGFRLVRMIIDLRTLFGSYACICYHFFQMTCCQPYNILILKHLKSKTLNCLKRGARDGAFIFRPFFACTNCFFCFGEVSMTTILHVQFVQVSYAQFFLILCPAASS